jgi:hypothetical protein
MISHKHVLNVYSELLEEIKVGQFEKLDILHHLASGMKSYFTQVANDGLYTIRQSVGGGGYTAWSGIP